MEFLNQIGTYVLQIVAGVTPVLVGLLTIWLRELMLQSKARQAALEADSARQTDSEDDRQKAIAHATNAIADNSSIALAVSQTRARKLAEHEINLLQGRREVLGVKIPPKKSSLPDIDIDDLPSLREDNLP